MYVWVSMIGNTHLVRNVKGKVEINQSIYARLQKNSSCPGSFGFRDFFNKSKIGSYFSAYRKCRHDSAVKKIYRKLIKSHCLKFII